MRTRIWLLCVSGPLCALALAIGYLARPEDEYAFLRKFRPTESIEHGPIELPSAGLAYPPPRHGELTLRRFRFNADPAAVGSSFRENIQVSEFGFQTFSLPSGREGIFLWSDGKCSAVVNETEGPWLQGAWSRIKRRLGL